MQQSCKIIFNALLKKEIRRKEAAARYNQIILVTAKFYVRPNLYHV